MLIVNDSAGSGSVGSKLSINTTLSPLEQNPHGPSLDFIEAGAASLFSLDKAAFIINAGENMHLPGERMAAFNT